MVANIVFLNPSLIVKRGKMGNNIIGERLIFSIIMSDKNNFGTGFILGTIVGGILGGVIGSIVASRSQSANPNGGKKGGKQEYFNSLDESQGENTRITLEEKINQLNRAIDEIKLDLLANSQKQREEV